MELSRLGSILARDRLGNMKRILVIGGNRFFGKRLVEKLVAEGGRVTILNRGSKSGSVPRGVREIKLDRKELRPDHPALGEDSWDIVYDQVCYDAVEAQAAVETFRGRVRKYVFTSSKSVYAQEPHLLESRFDPRAHHFDKIADRDKEYGEAKRQCEAVFFQRAEFPVVAVRFPVVLGLDDYTERLLFHIRHVKEEKPIYFPNLDAKMCAADSDDAAGFLAQIAHTDAVGPVNCCSSQPIALRALLSQIERLVGKRAVLARTEVEGDHSPYGVEADWYMDTPRLVEFGFTPKDLDAWLPSLIAACDPARTAYS